MTSLDETTAVIAKTLAAVAPPIHGIKPNGCYNREPLKPQVIRKPGYPMVVVPLRMSPDCQYTRSELGRQDARCAGCRWRSP